MDAYVIGYTKDKIRILDKSLSAKVKVYGYPKDDVLNAIIKGDIQVTIDGAREPGRRRKFTHESIWKEIQYTSLNIEDSDSKDKLLLLNIIRESYYTYRLYYSDIIGTEYSTTLDEIISNSYISSRFYKFQIINVGKGIGDIELRDGRRLILEYKDGIKPYIEISKTLNDNQAKFVAKANMLYSNTNDVIIENILNYRYKCMIPDILNMYKEYLSDRPKVFELDKSKLLSKSRDISQVWVTSKSILAKPKQQRKEITQPFTLILNLVSKYSISLLDKLSNEEADKLFKLIDSFGISTIVPIYDEGNEEILGIRIGQSKTNTDQIELLAFRVNKQIVYMTVWSEELDNLGILESAVKCNYKSIKPLFKPLTYPYRLLDSNGVNLELPLELVSLMLNYIEDYCLYLGKIVLDSAGKGIIYQYYLSLADGLIYKFVKNEESDYKVLDTYYEYGCYPKEVEHVIITQFLDNLYAMDTIDSLKKQLKLVR